MDFIVQNAEDEQDLIRYVEHLEDQIIFRKVSEQKVINCICDLLNLDFLKLSYTARESVLHMFCQAIENYNVSNKINWENIHKIKALLEDDLQEYVEDFPI